MDEVSIFTSALKKSDPAERSAYLEVACAGDAGLRRQVEALLQSHDEAGSFLQQPALGQQSGTGNEGDLGATQTETDLDDELSLDFLSPGEGPGSIGRLGHYEVQGVVGRGGMGVVLKAFDDVLHRVVAIKVMAPQLATSASARKRFLREARAAAAVRDEHVVGIHAVEEASGLPYLVMEYVKGSSLQERLDDGGPLELKETLRIGMQTAAGLAAAHKQGLVHRDVKPANILLENGVQRVKITDFGLARAVADDSRVSQSGVVAGTPQYMAPEQARGESVDHRADLFSLGSLLYAMCTGQPPFRASTTMAVLKQVAEDEPRPVREVNPESAARLAEIIEKLHAKDRADRFQSAAEVADLLGRHLAHLQAPAAVPLPPRIAGASRALLRRRPGRRWAVAAATVLLALCGLGLTEGAGVTKLVPTVIRVLTPSGALVVEVSDPQINVTVYGDGDEIAIAGAGLHEVRLRPGSYRVQASKDGVAIPLEHGLVTITRGGKQVVKVSRQSAGAQSAADVEPFATVRGPAMSSATFSRDGRFLAISSSNIIQVWDQSASKQIITLRGHRAWVWTVAFSPDSKTLASASMDSTVKLWDLNSGKERATLEGHTAKVWSVQFSPDGNTLASAGDDKSIRLWTVESGKFRKLLGVHDNHVYSAVFTPDGKTVISGDINGDVRLWDVSSGKVLAHLDGHAEVVRLAITSDGKTLATASHDRTVKLWDLGTRRLRTVLEGHTLPIERAEFSPDGKLLATVSGDFQAQTTPGEIKLWDVAQAQELLSLRPHNGPVHGVGFSPDGKTLASASADGTTKLWDVSRWTSPSPVQSVSQSSEVLLPTRQYGPHGIGVNCVAYVPGGMQIVSAGSDGTLRSWDLRSSAEIRRFTGHAGPVEGVAVSPDGETILSCGQDKSLRLWELATGKEIRRFLGHTGWVYGVAFSPDGKRALSAGTSWGGEAGNFLCLWDVQTGREIRRFHGHGDAILGVSFAPDGRRAISASFDRSVRLWDMETGRELRHFPHTSRVYAVAFSPDGRNIASGCGGSSLKDGAVFDPVNCVVRLWDAGTGREMRQFRGHTAGIRAVAWSPDGHFLLSATSGEHFDASRWQPPSEVGIRLWEAATGKQVCRFNTPNSISSLTFAADSRQFLSGGGNGSISLWELPQSLSSPGFPAQESRRAKATSAAEMNTPSQARRTTAAAGVGR
jgi:WD40 repeat protein